MLRLLISCTGRLKPQLHKQNLPPQVTKRPIFGESAQADLVYIAPEFYSEGLVQDVSLYIPSAHPVYPCQQKIAIEIKTFLGTSTLFEFHLAVGQFVNYRFTDYAVS